MHSPDPGTTIRDLIGKAHGAVAVERTGFGDADSKAIKTQRKTLGCLRDLSRVKSVGVTTDATNRGMATPEKKAVFAVKGRNAANIAPSQATLSTTNAAAGVRAKIKKRGLPADLVVVAKSQNYVRCAYASDAPKIQTQVRDRHGTHGKLNRQVIAKDADHPAEPAARENAVQTVLEAA